MLEKGWREEMKQVECAVCGAKLMFPSHGRFIDGSWTEDRAVMKEFYGEWVCCMNCYRKTFRSDSSYDESRE